MKQIVEIDWPTELLIGLHTNAEGFSIFLKEQAAISLFKYGKISSGIASNWLNISRMEFLRLASDAGATLLQDSSDDYRRETSLLWLFLVTQHLLLPFPASINWNFF